MPPPPAVLIEQAFQQQIQALQERLRQSEINLAAQHESMQINKKVFIEFFRIFIKSLFFLRLKFKKIFELLDKHVLQHKQPNQILILVNLIE
jgi:hypothetical protein